MITAFKSEGTNAYFIIRELKREYHDAAKDLYYNSYGDGFAKKFPADTPNLNHIYHNFELNAEEMILQTAMVHLAPWEKALKTFLSLVEDQNIDWWLTGSAALAVRGINILPRDIDLIVAEADCVRLGELLADYLVEPVIRNVGWIANWCGRTFINARLEWVSGVIDRVDTPNVSGFGPTATKMLEVVKWSGAKIRVPPVELQLQVSERRGLNERVKKIKLYQQGQL